MTELKSAAEITKLSKPDAWMLAAHLQWCLAQANAELACGDEDTEPQAKAVVEAADAIAMEVAGAAGRYKGRRTRV